jgi:hypothetical protein
MGTSFFKSFAVLAFTVPVIAFVLGCGSAGTGKIDITWYTKNPEAVAFQISNADQLAGLAALVNDGVGLGRSIDFSGKIINLTQNINLSKYGRGAKFNDGKGWVPIGRWDEEVEEATSFKGVFDGNGKRISGLYISDTSLNGAGLFGVIGVFDYDTGDYDDDDGNENLFKALADALGLRKDDGGADGEERAKGDSTAVKNLGLVDVHIIGGDYVGGMVGFVGGATLSNCYVTGTVGGSGHVGGIAGAVTFNSRVTNCYSAGTVSGSYQVGGITGIISYNSSVANSYSNATVNGNSSVGGITGIVSGEDCSVTNCYSTGAVSGDGRNVGGIAGIVEGDGSVANCAALNPSVMMRLVRSYGLGRVAGNNSGKMSGNVAFGGMTNGVGSTEWPNKGATGKDGINITVDGINADRTLGGFFTSANGWTVKSGKLPGFGAAVDFPEHFKAGYRAAVSPAYA